MSGSRSSWRGRSAAILIAILTVPSGASAADATSAAQQLMSALRWRSIGPYIGGRSVAVTGVPSNPDLFYFGGVQGGVWKSTTYGQYWTNITDGKIPGVADPIGALAVALSNPNVIYAGTGEADVRGDFDTGDGIYKTTDAGKTWSYAGLRESHTTTKIAIDPRDPNVAYAASLGHVFKPGAERGVFKTYDGGKTWRKVLFVDESTGCVDLAMDSRNAKVLYAAMWQVQRLPWKLTSGGPGSGLYKTIDAGVHWTKISANPGFPGNARKDRRRGRCEQSEDRLRDRTGARGRRFPIERRRRDVEAGQRGHEPAPAGVLLHGGFRRSEQSRCRIRSKRRRCL